MFFLNRIFKSKLIEIILINLSTALLYYGGGLLGGVMTSPGTWISSLWPASGIGVAMVLLFGFRKIIPGIILGSYLISLEYRFPTSDLIIQILGAIFEAGLAGNILLKLGKGKFRFKDYSEILSFFFVAVILAPFTTALLELSLMVAISETRFTIQLHELVKFFLGNGMGILIFSPLILNISQFKMRQKSHPLYWIEATLLVISLSYALHLSYEYKRTFMIYPFIVWAALRFSYLGVSVLSVLVGGTTIFRYILTSESSEIVWQQAHIGTCVIIGHLLATVITAQRKMLLKEQESLVNLEQRLMAEEALGVLDQAIQKSPVGFALISRDHRFIRVNEFMAKINGFSANYHTGRKIHELIPNIASYVEDAVNMVFETGESMLAIPAVVKPQGDMNKSYSGHVTYYPVRLPGIKEIFGVAIVFNDLTEEHDVKSKLHENQRWLNFSQEVGKMGLFECSFISHSARWTNQLEIIYGLKKDEFDGKLSTWLRFIHPEDLKHVNVALRNVNLIGEFSIQFRVIRADGAIRWVLCRGGAKRDDEGKLTGISGINVDITEQKMNEERLREAEGELLNALAVRDEFFAIASHELKTPLTSLKLQLQLHERSMRNGDVQATAKTKIEQLLTRNLLQTDRLSRLVDDMLDISRIRTGKLTLKKELCDISQILQDIVARNKEQFVASGSGEPIVTIMSSSLGNWDPLRIEQVLANLINNAIRYGKGRPIQIMLSEVECSARISITDQGFGIPQEERDKIFERFERGSKSREISGLGLGLFISKQIVDAHHGRIWVESEVNNGSTFHLEIPILKYCFNLGNVLEHNLA